MDGKQGIIKTTQEHLIFKWVKDLKKLFSKKSANKWSWFEFSNNGQMIVINDLCFFDLLQGSLKV